MPLTFEVPVFSATAASVAVDRGATRLEINRAGSYAEGGLTPTLAEVQAIVASGSVSVPLRVMIRPRGPPAEGAEEERAEEEEEEADFLYTDDEFQQMCCALDAFVASGLLQPSRGDGFVFGILKRADTGRLVVDVDRNQQLVKAAAPYACVFHRAFDLILGDMPSKEGGEAGTQEALATLLQCGFTGVLTAGGPGSRGAADHASTLQKLAAAAAAEGVGRAESPSAKRIEIIVGGGVRSSNVGTLAEHILAGDNLPTDAVSFHSSCLINPAAAIARGAEGEGVNGDEVERISRVLVSL
ncbi:hypothetical protein SCUCBS95973_005042 [Sporothrix curviconia]|uniref:Copper homeostasis protein cutC homolog n=1 Tax=Sporothrix curviconia TaxID=1260050 RepID=A0ABP0BTU6_9PEZI